MTKEHKAIRDALERLIHCGQKQGFNDGYATEMDDARQALATLDSIMAVPDGYVMVPMSLIEQRPAVVYGRGKGANKTYRPNVGERCLVSPPNCDDDNGYIFQEYNILWSNDIFVLYGNDGYYPNMDKWEHIIAKPLPAAPKHGGEV